MASMFETIGREARRLVEQGVDDIRESCRGYEQYGNVRATHATVLNGSVKPEGEEGSGHVAEAGDVPELLEPFVACCLSLRRPGDTTLIWRRFPSVERGEKGYKLTARLSWVNLHG